MLSTDATKFSKKEGDSTGKWGEDPAKSHRQHKMVLHLRGTQNQIKEPRVTTQTKMPG